MVSTHEGELDLPDLPLAARHVHIVPALQDFSLVSIGQLCDASCSIEFTANSVLVHYNDKLVLCGSRTPETKLWHLDFPKSTEAAALLTDFVPSALALSQEFSGGLIGAASPANLVAFAHSALFSPVLSTLEKALQQGFLHNFPGLSLPTLRKFPP